MDGRSEISDCTNSESSCGADDNPAANIKYPPSTRYVSTAETVMPSSNFPASSVKAQQQSNHERFTSAFLISSKY